MESSRIKAAQLKKKRALRVRSKLKGTAERPRMSVLKTNQHISVQIIDDVNGMTLAHASTDSKELRGTEFKKKNKASARKVGEMIAQKVKALGIQAVIFDRGASKFHGVLAELANAAKEQGLVL